MCPGSFHVILYHKSDQLVELIHWGPAGPFNHLDQAGIGLGERDLVLEITYVPANSVEEVIFTE